MVAPTTTPEMCRVRNCVMCIKFATAACVKRFWGVEKLRCKKKMSPEWDSDRHGIGRG